MSSELRIVGSNDVSQETPNKSHSNSYNCWKFLCIVQALLIIFVTLGAMFVAVYEGKSVLKIQAFNSKVNVKILTTSLHNNPPNQFDDLNDEEVKVIKEYITRQLNLVDNIKADVNDSYIYDMHLVEPSKAFDRLPQRQALTIVFHGSWDVPVVKEYFVGPLIKNKPQLLTHSESQTLDFHKRPLSKPEYKALKRKITDIIKERAVFQKCSVRKEIIERFLCQNSAVDVSVRDRKTWFRFNSRIKGFCQQLTHLQLLISHIGVDIHKWTVLTNKSVSEKNGIFRDLGFFDPNDFPKLQMKWMKIRPQNSWFPSRTISVSANSYLITREWRLKVSFRSATGLRLFDIAYKNRSVAYELGLADVANLREGNSLSIERPFSAESVLRISSHTFDLKPDIDCPKNAHYFSAWVVNEGEPSLIHRAVCAFESWSSDPAYRHLEFNFQRSASYFEGALYRALTIRSISALFGRVYAFDYVFYQTGLIEVLVTPIGSIESKLGMSMNYHLFHYKLDFDVYTRENIMYKLKVNSETLRLENTTVSKESYSKTRREKDSVQPERSGSTYHLLCRQDARTCCYRILNRAEMNFNVLSDTNIPWTQIMHGVTVRDDGFGKESLFYNDTFNQLLHKRTYSNYFKTPKPAINKDLINWITMSASYFNNISDNLSHLTTADGQLRTFLIPYNFMGCDPQI